MMSTEITWIAHLTDGSTLSQGYGATYATLPRDRLQAFDLWQGGRILVRVDLREDELGKRALIYRKRTQMRTNGEQVAYYMVGWQRVVEGVKVQAICYVFEDGSVLLGGQFRDGDELMDSIVPFEWEKDLI